MPQMSPLWWSLLFIFFFFLMIMFVVVIYSYTFVNKAPSVQLKIEGTHSFWSW